LFLRKQAIIAQIVQKHLKMLCFINSDTAWSIRLWQSNPQLQETTSKISRPRTLDWDRKVVVAALTFLSGAPYRNCLRKQEGK